MIPELRTAYLQESAGGQEEESEERRSREGFTDDGFDSGNKGKKTGAGNNGPEESGRRISAIGEGCKSRIKEYKIILARPNRLLPLHLTKPTHMIDSLNTIGTNKVCMAPFSFSVYRK
jgi:hypothetical protein